MKVYFRAWLTVLALALAALVMVILATQPAHAAGPWYVGPGGSDSNTCLSPATRCATINGALNKAGFVAGDTVLVATGIYTGTGSEVVLLNKNATLSGGWNASFTTQSGTSTIDGQGARRGIAVNSGVTAVVERFVVQNGSSGGQGGGVFNVGTLTLNSSAVSGNMTSDFEGGGGIANSDAATLTLNNSTISNNVSIYHGGGITNLGTLVVNNSAITRNRANSEGGGGILNASQATMILNNSTVSGNMASTSSGGGIINVGTLTLNSSTISDNMAWYGGGIELNSGTAILRNTILARNTANRAPDCSYTSGTIGSTGYNLIGNISGCPFTPTTGDLTNIDAKLGPLMGSPGAPWYHPLLPASLAINAGDPAGCFGSNGLLTTDQRGLARVGRCDIGAYEYTAATGPANSVAAIGGTPQRTPPFLAFKIPLQAAVLDNLGSPVSNVTVIFAAPASGASGTFANSGTFSATAVTDESGAAIASTFTANGLSGSYLITATVSGIITPTSFLLNNIGWYVAPGGNDDSSCLSPSTACATINGALSKSDFVAGDTIQVATGTYTGTGSQVVLLNKNATLSGGWNVGFTAQSGASTIDGGGARRGITVNNGVTAIVEHFTVQNGSSGGDGGGILNNNRGTLTLNNTTINGNIADDWGGGICNWGTVTLNKCAVSGNVVIGSSGSGGGIDNRGIMTLNNSAISDNMAGWHSGGIHNGDGGILVLNNSTVSGNTARTISGIYNDGTYGPVATLTLNNSTVSSNIASSTDANGGGILNYYSNSTVTLQNTIVAGNVASGAGPDCWGVIGTSGYNLIGNTSGCTFTPTGGDLINTNPLLGPLEGSPGYHPLLSGSPAINAGNPAGCIDHLGNPLLTDQRGMPRVGRCDIGAYEVGLSATKQASGTYIPGGSLTYIITLNNAASTTITGVRITDTLPASLTYVAGSFSATTGTGGQSGGVITWTGTVPARGGTTISFRAIISDNVPSCSVITNKATIGGQGYEFEREATGATPCVYNLTKQAVGTYTPGTSLVYIITLYDEADGDVTGVLITDTLPISLTYVAGSFSATTGTGGESGGVITWTGTVPAHGSVKISFGAAIDDDVPGCSLITNKATIGGQGYEFERQVTGATPCVCDLTKHTGNPVLSIGAGGSWDDDDVWGPAVLKEGGGYKMWYSGDDGSGPSRIGLATSTDGITWTKSISNPVLSPGPSWETGGIRAGSVISDGGLYKMWYTGLDSNGVARIGYATSPDGVNWTKYGGNPVLGIGAAGSWEDNDVMRPTVIKEGSTYHLWYTGDDGVTSRIGHATSSNGTNWTKDPANPVLDLGPPGGWDWLNVYGPNAVAYGDTYVLWYSGGTLPEAWQTGYALSSDGSDWTRQEMLIPEGPSGSFDADSADYASVIVDGDELKVWYSGLSDGGTYSIGYATAEICSESGSAPPTNPVYLPIVLKGGGAQPACPPYYTDNFSDPDSGWPIGEDSKYAYGYISSQYQIRVKTPPGGFMVTPGAKATDFTAAVSARRTSGTYGAYAIVFGINEDWSQWYEFDIDAQYYSIWKYDHGTSTPLRNWTTSGYIKTGTNWNRLKVIRNGASIAVYANNQLLTTITEGSFTGLRRIGLYAGSGSALDARFDDFSLYPASCGPSAAGVGFEMGEPGVHEAPMPPGWDQLP